MRKKVKRLKITEEMMNEIISADGGIINGGEIEYPGSSRIRTTTYSDKKDGMAWHTDNQRYSANQDGKFYYYFRGYGYSSGNVSESYIIEDDLKEDYLSDRFDSPELINKDKSTIPDFNQLYDTYNLDNVADEAENLIGSVKNFSKSDNYKDIIAMIIKKMITDLDTEQLASNERKELKDSI